MNESMATKVELNAASSAAGYAVDFAPRDTAGNSADKSTAADKSVAGNPRMAAGNSTADSRPADCRTADKRAVAAGSFGWDIATADNRPVAGSRSVADNGSRRSDKTAADNWTADN